MSRRIRCNPRQGSTACRYYKEEFKLVTQIIRHRDNRLQCTRHLPAVFNDQYAWPGIHPITLLTTLIVSAFVLSHEKNGAPSTTRFRHTPNNSLSFTTSRSFCVHLSIDNCRSSKIC